MNARVWLMIVSLAVLSIGATGTVRAASFDVEVKLFQEISTCPTIMEDTPPLNKDDVPIFINNFYEYPDVFQLSLELPEGWQGFVKPEFMVDAGQKKEIDPIWITVPDVEPGTYEVAIKAKSGQTGDEIRKTFQVEVLSCHHVTLDAVEAYREVCREEPEEAYVQLRIKNDGAVSETFELSVYQAGLLIGWATGIPSIAVPAGEETIVNFTFSPPADLLGEQRFTIVAKSKTSYAEDSAEVRLVFKDCYSFEAVLEPWEVPVCSGERGDFTLRLTNKGKADTLKVTVPWLGIEEDVSLEQNEKKEIKITAEQDVIGKHTFDVTVASTKDEAGVVVLAGTLNVQECRGLAIVVTPEKETVCSGEKVLFKVMVKNTGSIAEDVELSADMGVLETSSFSLEAKEVRTVDLVVDTKDFTGEKTVTVTARSGVIEDHSTVEIVAEDCYSAMVSAVPESVKLCPCEEAEIVISVENTGKLEDSYTVVLGEEKETVDIQPGEKAEVKLTLKVPCDAKEAFSKSVRVESAFTVYEKQIAVEPEKLEDCYAVTLYDGEYVEVQAAKSFALPVHVKNTGKLEDIYQFILEGPAWVYLEPARHTLGAGENDSVFVYISPPFDTVQKVYQAIVKAKSGRTEVSHKVVINVTEGLPAEAEPEPEVGEPVTEVNVTVDENVTLGPEDEGVVLNVSVNESELPTARVIQLEKTTRLIIVGVIVIAIILILVVRFMTLVK